MALSTREVLMIIRAKDLASSELARIGTAFSALDHDAQNAARSMIAQGSALMGVGAAFGIAGAAALTFFGNSARAAMEYNRESALTLTQVDRLGVSLKDIEDIGIRVARAIPAPFKEMQKSLYDIFSSMDVDVKGAEVLLEGFARAAVAGQTSVQTAGRATIAIMNGMGLETKDLNRILDVQFQIVRKGVISYDEFASTIGRAIPSARNAGQSIEELGGMIAFLTRNGLSAAMAATSAARAMDLFANPKFAKEMKELGISVFDAAGNFRPLHQVIKELNDVMGEMTAEEQAAALKELTKGAGGTIQAMRFMNVAVRDTNGELKNLGDFVRSSAGELEKAYKIMANTPAAKIQELTNAWQILRREIGIRVLPAFAALAVAAKNVIDWFLDLDDKTKDVIVRIGLFTAAVVTLTGVLAGIAGAVFILRGTFTLLGGAMLPIIATVVGFTALSAAIVYLATQTEMLAKVWDGFEVVAKAVWSRVQELRKAFDEDGLGGVIRKVAQIWDRDFPRLHDLVHDYVIEVVGTIRNATPLIVAALKRWSEALGEWIGNVVPPVVEALRNYLNTVVNWLTGEGPGQVARAMLHWGQHLWSWIVTATGPTVEKLNGWISAIVNWIKNTGAPILWGGIQFFAKMLVDWIAESGPKAIGEFLKFISAIRDWILTHGVTMLVKAIEYWRETLYPWIMDAIPKAIAALGIFIQAMVQFLEPAVNLLFGVMQKYIPVLWEWIKEAAPKVVRALGDLIEVLVEGLSNLVDAGKNYLAKNGQRIFEGFLNLEDKFFDWFGPVSADIVRAFGDMIADIITWLGNHSGDIVTIFLMVGQRIMDYLVLELLPAVADAADKIGWAFIKGIAHGLLKIPAALGNYWFKPLREAIQQQSEFENEVRVSWDTIVDLMNSTAPQAAKNLEFLRDAGWDVSSAFKDIAMTSPNMAKAILEALRRSGADVKIYEQALVDLQKVQGETGENARQAFGKAEDASRAYGNQIDRLLMSVTSVKDASANFELALHALNQQIEANKTSTESAAVQEARLQLAFSRTIKEVGDYIKEIEKQGLSTDEAKAAVKHHMDQLEEMKTKLPGQTDAINPLIERIKDLTRTTNEAKADGLKAWQEFRDGSRTTFEGIKTELITISNAMHKELTEKHKATGNDSYTFMMEALRKLPDSTGEVSQKTFDAVVNVLQKMPGYTGGAGQESVDAWLRHLATGTGGTDATTAGWARAMLAILNPILKGVGASPVYIGTGLEADGGVLEFYKRGGIRDRSENHVAQIAQAGTWRVWAEPETGGEAYIPLAQNKRERSVKILREVAERFGMAVADYQEGGIRWPEVPDFSAYGTMIGDRGGYDTTKYTRDIVVAWNAERERKLAEQKAAAGGSSSTTGLTEAAQAMVNAVLSNFPDQTMTSGFRTPEENARVGGAPNSDHMYGRAADFAPGSDAVADFLNNYPGIKQVLWQVAGHYDHVHGAVYDKGGILGRGLNMIMNGTGKPEAVFNWEQFQAIEWLMGHVKEAKEATQASSASGPFVGAFGELQGAARAISGAGGMLGGGNLMGIGGVPGYRPSLGMALETIGHTVGLLGSLSTPGGIRSATTDVGAAGFSGGFGNPVGFLGYNSQSATVGPMFTEGAITMNITGSNPEQIAAQVEAKIRALIAEIRVR